jgi:nitrogen-specific signal transduction histidine kinase
MDDNEGVLDLRHLALEVGRVDVADGAEAVGKGLLLHFFNPLASERVGSGGLGSHLYSSQKRSSSSSIKSSSSPERTSSAFLSWAMRSKA